VFEVCRSSKGLLRYWVDKIFLYPVLIDLTFDLLTSKSIGVFLYLSPTHIWNSITIVRKVLKILSEHHLIYRSTGAKQYAPPLRRGHKYKIGNKIQGSERPKKRIAQVSDLAVLAIEITYCSFTGVVVAYIRDCSDGINFSINASRFQTLSPERNVTTCAYEEGKFFTCLSLCNEDLCNGPQTDSNTSSSPRAVALVWLTILITVILPRVPWTRDGQWLYIFSLSKNWIYVT
jgi:hypothetical protein